VLTTGSVTVIVTEKSVNCNYTAWALVKSD